MFPHADAINLFLCASCAVPNAAFCMTCSLLMLYEDARSDHMEEAYFRTGSMTVGAVCEFWV